MTLHRNPVPTVDAIIELSGGRVVLIERANPPFGWAFPGGFVDYGETVEDACAREAREETGLRVDVIHLLGVYSDPRRDARLHTISTVFVAAADGVPCAGDDAASAVAVPHAELLDRTFAFDHRRIAEDYLRWRAQG